VAADTTDSVMAMLGHAYRSATGIDAEMFATRAAAGARVLPA